MLLIRYTEYFLCNSNLTNIHSQNFLWKYCIHYDVFFAFKFSLIILPLYLISASFPKIQRAGILIYQILWSLIITLTCLLTYFFLASKYLLTEVVFHYTWAELMHIVNIDSNANNDFYWTIYLLVPLGIFLIFIIPSKIKLTHKKVLITLSTLFLLIVLIISKNWKKDGKELSHFENQYAYYLGTCKTNFFLSSCITALKEKRITTDKEVTQAIISYQQSFKNRKFTSIEYPLIHNLEDENVLGPYFIKSTKKPNIVFIISEGLSAGFSGLHPTVKSLTPFVDSLAKKGLYWSNFLSNCNRTFGVLPNVLGSLPNGTMERGFMNFNGNDFYNQQYPNHTSLVRELKNNNYTTAFMYGGWGDFDNMKSFLTQQNFDILIEQGNFDSLKYLSPWKRIPKGFYWGYDDHALVGQWFDKLTKINSPYLSVLLTLNMHEPYNITPKKYTNKTFVKTRLNKIYKGKNPYINSDPLVLGSIFYYEDALKKLIYTYKKRKDFNNTIFIIFGDHYSFTAYLNNPLDIYHIPFLIYSPLITKPKQFDAVSTHQDIAPSLNALLKNNFGLNFPSTNHYIGTELDTNSTFRSKKIVPFNAYNKNNYPYYLFGKYILTDEGVFEIKKNLQLTKVTSPTIIKNVKNHFHYYKIVDRYVCEKNKIWR